MLNIALLIFGLIRIDLSPFTSVQRWYFYKEKAYIITSDFVLKIEFKQDSVVLDTLVPEGGVNNLVFKVDTFNFYNRKSGFYVNNKQVLPPLFIKDIGASSDNVGILTGNVLYLLNLKTMKVDSIKINQKISAISLTHSGVFLIPPAPFVYYQLFYKNHRDTIYAEEVYKYFPVYGLKEKGKGIFLGGGIVGVCPYKSKYVIWGFYYEHLEKMIGQIPRTCLFLVDIKKGKVVVKKHFEFKKPVYPIMINNAGIYLAEFDFTKGKKEVVIWKLPL